MKVIGITSAAILSLLLGIAAPACAQHGQQGDKQGHPQQQQSKHEQAKPKQQHAQQQRQSNQRQRQPQHVQQQQRQGQSKPHAYAQQHRGNAQPRRTQERQRVRQSAWQQHRAQNWQSDHRTWQQRGGYNGYRISDARFRGYFGPEHRFRIRGLPFLMTGGYPRFQYNGYWFSLVDPWPQYWANNWYDTDDVYVNYVDNGYYLFDRRYPNDGIAISISLR
jgi:hypothetical protein